MKKLYLIHCRGLGDIISATPSLRKLSKSYGEKIDVVTYSPELFKNNPYVNKVFSWEDDVDKIKSEYQEEGIFNTSNGHQLNHSFDIRALHAKYLGFGLLPEEMEHDFIPDKYKDLNLPSNYICIHPAFNWESRTWPQEKWQELIDHLISLGYFVVAVGKDDTRLEDGEWGKKSGLKYIFNFKEHPKLINLTNKANLSQTWHIINRAEKFITMDTGLLHLAGCTNVEIIQLGSSINYKLRAPFRMGSQEYRYTYVGGDCDIFCASDLKYAVKEHGKFNVTPPLWKCLESKETFECHPSVEKVSKLFSPVKELKAFESEPEQWQKDIGVEKVKIYSACGSSWSEYLWGEIIVDRGYERYFKIEEDDIVFDIGANVGYFALTCSKRKIKRCYCFEPMPLNFLCLNKNITELEDSKNFTLVQKAISPCKEIYVGEQQDQTTPYTEKKKTNNCTILNTVKLVDFVKENKIKKVDFIKMDIEGGEWDIFESEDFEWILKNTKKFVAEIHLENNESGHQERFNVDFINRFEENGFSTKITSLDGHNIKHNILNNIYLTNRQQNAHDYYNQIIFYAWKDKASISEDCLVKTSFVDGAFCELSGNFSGKRKVSFIDSENNQLVYQTSLPCHHWAKPSLKTFINWRIKIEKENGQIVYEETFNAEDKKVLISFDSSSVGDTIAWIPYVEQFRIKHNCIIFCQTFHNSLLRESYPNINFISHDEIVDCYASYELGWFEDWENTNRNPNDPRSIPLQQTASDILGLEHREVRPRLHKKDRPRNLKEKYICISIASTAGLKHWQNESGWQQTVDYLNELGYKVVVIQREPLGWMDTPFLKNVIHPEATDLEQAASWIQHCEFFIGLGSGISWLAWALNKKVILISGFSKKFAEFETPYRVQNLEVCNGCWNDTRHKFDKGDWSWCPEDKNFECSKSITFKFVKEQIDKIIHNKKNKIGIQFLAYNCQKSFKEFISPWLKLKSKYDLYFFVGSTQFTLYKELGYEDKNTETVRMLQSEYNHVIDHLYSPEESKTEEEVRNRCLELFKEKGIDIMWAVDSDEFFTEEEIEGIIQFVKENEQYDWFQVKYKNYIGDGSGWIDFEAPRIWRIKANNGVSHFYRDCWITYNNNKECREANWKTIPEEVARPKHMSWVEGFEESRPSNAKAKVDYQIANYGEDWGCSFKWDDEKNKLSLNKDWYKAHQEKIPEVHYDNEIDLNFDFFYHEDGGPHGNLKPAPDFKITFNSNRGQAYEIIIRDKHTKNIFRYYKNYKAEKNIKYYISIGPRYELISQVKQIEVIFTDQQGNIVFKETILNDALNQKYEKISKKTFYDQEVDLKKNSLINKDVYLEMRKVIDGKCHGDNGNLEGMGLMYYSIINLLKPRNILCIGSGDGYVPCLIRQAQRDLKIEGKTYLVDADLPELGFGGPSYLEDGSALKTAYPEIEIITETSCQAYENVFKDVELDYIHIDADHSYEGVKSDFYNYINSLSQNGVITLHDTRVYGWPDEHSVMMRVFEGWTAVPTFLEELKKDKSFEIINFDQFGSGTAIVKRKSLSVKEANASDKIESFEGSPLLKV